MSYTLNGIQSARLYEKSQGWNDDNSPKEEAFDYLIDVSSGLLEACESAARFLNLISTKEHNPELIASICLIREMTLEPAIAKARGNNEIQSANASQTNS